MKKQNTSTTKIVNPIEANSTPKKVVGFLTNKVVFGYSMGQFGWAILMGLVSSQLTTVWVGTTTPNNMLPGFIDAGIFSAIFVVTKIMDAFSAPLIGQLSDRINTKWGRRIPFMAMAVFPLALFTVVLFVLFDAKTGASVSIKIGATVFLAVFLSFFYISLNTYVIPYTSLVNDLSSSSKDRIKLNTTIAISYIIGTIASAGAPMLWNFLYDTGFITEPKYAIITAIAIFTIIGTILLIVPLFSVKEKIWLHLDTLAAKKKESLAKEKLIKLKSQRLIKKEGIIGSVIHILRQGQYKWIILADFFLWIGLIGFQTQINYIVSAILGLNMSWAIYFSGALAVVSLMLYPAFAAWMSRVGVRKQLVQMGFVVYIICFIFGGVMAMDSGTKGTTTALIEGLGLIALIGIPTAVMGVVKNVIISDIIATNSLLNNEDQTATYYAVRSFINKIAIAIGGGISIALLKFGHDSTNDWGIRAGMFLAAFTSVLALICISMYKEMKFRYNREFHKFIRLQKLVTKLECKVKTTKSKEDVDKLKERIAKLKKEVNNQYKLAQKKGNEASTKMVKRNNLKVEGIIQNIKTLSSTSATADEKEKRKAAIIKKISRGEAKLVKINAQLKTSGLKEKKIAHLKLMTNVYVEYIAHEKSLLNNISKLTKLNAKQKEILFEKLQVLHLSTKGYNTFRTGLSLAKLSETRFTK